MKTLLNTCENMYRFCLRNVSDDRRMAGENLKCFVIKLPLPEIERWNKCGSVWCAEVNIWKSANKDEMTKKEATILTRRRRRRWHRAATQRSRRRRRRYNKNQQRQRRCVWLEYVIREQCWQIPIDMIVCAGVACSTLRYAMQYACVVRCAFWHSLSFCVLLPPTSIRFVDKT